MTTQQTPPTLVSACLLGKPCRFDGTASTDPLVVGAATSRLFIPICPEVDGGLSIPRAPAEIVGGDGHDVLAGRARVMDHDGIDRTQSYLTGAQSAVEAARRSGAHEAWLKSRSPACGCGSIYDGAFSGRIRPGVGVATAMLQKAGVFCKEWPGAISSSTGDKASMRR